MPSTILEWNNIREEREIPDSGTKVIVYRYRGQFEILDIEDDTNLDFDVWAYLHAPAPHLNSCPHCNGEAWVERDSEEYIRIMCRACNSGQHGFRGPEFAIKQWNTRVHRPDLGCV